jgi:hypothetical protein
VCSFDENCVLLPFKSCVELMVNVGEFGAHHSRYAQNLC